MVYPSIPWKMNGTFHMPESCGPEACARKSDTLHGEGFLLPQLWHQMRASLCFATERFVLVLSQTQLAIPSWRRRSSPRKQTCQLFRQKSNVFCSFHNLDGHCGIQLYNSRTLEVKKKSNSHIHEELTTSVKISLLQPNFYWKDGS
jgi:hypothetical protein